MDADAGGNKPAYADIKRMQAEREARIATGTGQQLFARIRKTSKYYGQGESDARFPVIVEGPPGGYCVLGGAGGQYRLRDVVLLVLWRDQEIILSE